MKNNWNCYRLGELCEFINGDAYKPSDWSDFGVPIIRIQNLNNHSKNFNYWAGSIEGRVRVKNGDILLAWSGTPGTSFGVHRWERGPAVLNQHIFRVDFKDKSIHPDFFVYSVNYHLNLLINKAHGGVGLRHVTKNEVESMQILIPALDEQKQIVVFLNQRLASVENAKTAAEKQLEDIRALRAAYLWEVFSSAGERLPDTWKWVKFGIIVNDYMSGFACGERDENGAVQLRMNNINTQGQFVWDQITRVPFTIEKINKYSLRPGDVLFNNTNSTELVGKSSLFTSYVEPVLFSNHFTRLRFKTSLVEPTFVTNWLIFKWQTKVFAELCNRWIGQSAIKPNVLFELDFPLPPIEDQKKIITKLDENFKAINIAENMTKDQLIELNLLPQAYLRQAFRGELA